MAEYSVKRKLRAILGADVKWHHRLMGVDEVDTLHTLSSFPKINVEHKTRMGG